MKPIGPGKSLFAYTINQSADDAMQLDFTLSALTILCLRDK